MSSRGIEPEKSRFLKIEKIKGVTVYKMIFKSIGEVEVFLRANPDVNKEVFFEQKSRTAEFEFAGPSLEESIVHCIRGYEEGLDQFLILSKKMDAVNRTFVNGRTTVKSFVGQRPCVPAYIAGAPKTMYRTSRVQEKKCINIFMNVTYPASTKVEQIQARGIIAINLIKVLEQNGYIVNFRLFEASIMREEVFLCEVALKNPGEKLDVKKSYYPLCGKAFVRRIMARIKESVPFHANWGMSYGTLVKPDLVKEILGITEKDIYIGSPDEMGIVGDNIFKDADTFFGKLNLDNTISIPKYVKDEEEYIRKKKEKEALINDSYSYHELNKMEKARNNKWQS